MILVGLVFDEKWVFEDFVFEKYGLDDDDHKDGTAIEIRLHEGGYWMILE